MARGMSPNYPPPRTSLSIFLHVPHRLLEGFVASHPGTRSDDPGPVYSNPLTLKYGRGFILATHCPDTYVTMGALNSGKRRERLTTVRLVILAIALAGSSSVNGVEPSRADRILEIRLAVMVAQSGTVPTLAAMVNGKSPFEPKRAQVLAERAAMLASMSSETFPDDSKIASKSLARPEVWSQRAEFNQLMAAYVEKSAALVPAAKTGRIDALRPAVADVGRTCRSCHERFEDLP
jgi:cytochrome c556